MLQVLVERGEVSVITGTRPQLEKLDHWCGTRLRQAKLHVYPVHWWLSGPLERLGQPHDLWRFRYLLRKARQEKNHHRVCVSSFNDLDMGPGAPILQYFHMAPCHDPQSVKKNTFTRSSSPLAQGALHFYRWVAELLASWDNTRVARNMTLANSDWTSKKFEQVYGRPADEILYPPPLGQIPDSLSHDGRPSFISLARAEPLKGWDDILEIVGRLRKLGHPAKLSMFVMPGQEGYLEYLKQRTAEHPDWLSLQVNASREEIDLAIASHQFGLQAGRGEAYGMAVAELLLGGCLTAVRDEGGQTEIVSEPELRFTDVDDATRKLDRILSCPKLAARLKASQQTRQSRYTREAFLAGFHACLDRFEATL